MAMFSNLSHPRLWDRISVFLSGLCVVHCAALPVLLVAAPLTSGLFGAETHFHLAMLAMIAPITLFALASGYQHHRDNGIVATGAVGIVLLIVGASYAHAHLGTLVEALITVAGSAALAVAHINNMRRCRIVDAEAQPDSPLFSG